MKFFINIVHNTLQLNPYLKMTTRVTDVAYKIFGGRKRKSLKRKSLKRKSLKRKSLKRRGGFGRRVTVIGM